MLSSVVLVFVLPMELSCLVPQMTLNYAFYLRNKLNCKIAEQHHMSLSFNMQHLTEEQLLQSLNHQQHLAEYVCTSNVIS